ncbi:MAG: isoprenylcysteine carboxylmethyltransferase family protein [Marinilabiliales bacterium]|nr:isoprenylcysteine carboxylmethyltransferase family protein [Marinilabiliales bacterium]
MSMMAKKRRFGDFIGSGRKIMVTVVGMVVLCLIIGHIYPGIFALDGSYPWLHWVSLLLLTVGIINWAWTILLIVRMIPRGLLITTGPFSLVKHPLYTGVAWLILPEIGFLCHSWLGLILGLAMYLATRILAKEEEKQLAATFGKQWEAYCQTIVLPWL